MVDALIYDAGDAAERADSGAPQAVKAKLALDELRHPWLRGMDERDLANLAVALTNFLCRPSYGARTKREIEFEVFARLREFRDDWTTLGQIADDLAISRSRARGLVLEHRARLVGGSGPGARRKILHEEVLNWPMKQIELGDHDRLRIVIDDPFVRDLLKNFAYANGILLDQSFASEVQTFSWDSYARLLMLFYSDGSKLDVDEFLILTADLRRQVTTSAARVAASSVELRAQLTEIEELAQKARKSKAERRQELALDILRKYGPTIAKVATKTIVPTPS